MQARTCRSADSRRRLVHSKDRRNRSTCKKTKLVRHCARGVRGGETHLYATGATRQPGPAAGAAAAAAAGTAAAAAAAAGINEFGMETTIVVLCEYLLFELRHPQRSARYGPSSTGTLPSLPTCWDDMLARLREAGSRNLVSKKQIPSPNRKDEKFD